MAQMVKCRVCGKEYTPCKSAKYDPRVYNWREVSCSPDCGQIYLKQIIDSRTPSVEPARKRIKKKPVEIEIKEPEVLSDEDI